MRRYAITVGIQEYASGSGVAPLQYACADAEAIGYVLREYCRFDEVQILTTSSTAEGQLTDTMILSTLRDIAGQLNHDDLFLFFFAGHGIERQLGGQSRSFLLAPNASLQFMTGLMDLAMIREIMARMACSQRMFLLDCCRNDPDAGRGDAGNPMTARFTRDIVAAANRPYRNQTNPVTLVLNACRPGERSYERADVGHGAFSHWIIEGLKGEAWAEEGLEGARLCRYVESSLAAWSQRTGVSQHADFQQLESASKVWLAGAFRPAKNVLPEPLIIPPFSEIPTDAELRFSTGMFIPLLYVPAGEFVMGARIDDSEAFSNERPRHKVRLSRDVLITKRPVTVKQWNDIMDSQGKNHCEEEKLKTGVSWDQAQEFLLLLNEHLNEGGCRVKGLPGECFARLPSEAEWEYALTLVDIHRHPEWIGSCWQWCEDWYGPYIHGLAIDPAGPRDGTERVIRGGSPACDQRFLRPTARGHLPPGSRRKDVGFRFVMLSKEL